MPASFCLFSGVYIYLLGKRYAYAVYLFYDVPKYQPETFKITQLAIQDILNCALPSYIREGKRSNVRNSLYPFFVS